MSSSKVDRFRQTKTKMINDPYTHKYRRIHFISENAAFCDNR